MGLSEAPHAPSLEAEPFSLPLTSSLPKSVRILRRAVCHEDVRSAPLLPGHTAVGGRPCGCFTRVRCVDCSEPDRTSARAADLPVK